MSAARLRLLTGASVRLRDEAQAALLRDHDGPVERADAGRFDELRMAMDTPSLFGPAPLLIVRCDAAWLKQHAEAIAALADETGPGAVLLVADAIDGRSALAKRLDAAGAWLRADEPGSRPQDVESWLLGRLHGLGRPVERPQEVARSLLAHRGADPDGLLAAVDQVLDYILDEEPLRAADVDVVVGGAATRKGWEFAEAALAGDPAKALAIAHAGEGLEVEQLLAALHGELRLLAACCVTTDDQQATAWAGRDGVRYLAPARRRAQSLGAATCARLLDGAAQAQRQCRSGSDPWWALETFLLHARRVIRPRS
jgi:DNA polymerase III delta subunit